MSLWSSIKSVFVSSPVVDEAPVEAGPIVEIVDSQIESVHGREQRMVWYRVQDGDGNWTSYGPVITSDPKWDAEAHKELVAVKVGKSLLAAAEAKLADPVKG